MSRIATTETIAVPASNNVYTVLVAAACIAVAIGLGVVFIKANALGVQLLKF